MHNIGPLLQNIRETYNEMDKSEMSNNEFIQGWSYLTNDKERFEYLRVHQDTGVILYLDNDMTFIGFEDDENGDIKDQVNTSFDNYLGWSSGIFNLLAVYGIKAESV